MAMHAAAVLTAIATAASAAKQPHLVLMVLDDMGWSDVGFHGSGSNFPTPQLDSLAANGVILDKYYVQQVCSPTRSALMTGRYPFKTGLQHTTTLVPGTSAAIPKDTSTIAEVLKGAGYATHAIGKWHLGMKSWSDTPLGRGFDSWAGYLNGAIDYYTHKTTFQDGMDLWRNKTAAWDVQTYGKHTTEFYMEEAQRVLDNHDASNPLFVYFAHQLIHNPHEQPPDAASKAACAKENASSPIGEWATTARRTLCTMTSEVDTAVGEFVQMLEAKGMWNDTILWVTTDNGGMTTGPRWSKDDVSNRAWSTASNFPLRGGKTTLFEGGVRGVSFVTGGANVFPAAARGQTRQGNEHLMQHVDVPATMASLAGAEWGDSTAVDGLDVWDTITTGTPSPRDEVPVNVDTCVGAPTGGWPCGKDKVFNALISKDGYKLIEANFVPQNCPTNITWCTGNGLYDGWWSNDPYTHTLPNATTQGPMPDSGILNGGIWLFNLTADPNELLNIAASNTAVVQKMRARLNELANPKNGYTIPQTNLPSPLSFPILHNHTWAPFVGEEEHDTRMTLEEAEEAIKVLASGPSWD